MSPQAAPGTPVKPGMLILAVGRRAAQAHSSRLEEQLVARKVYP